ncbi:hypothetical protein F511_36429 [Dorcoceras hygrometricum]|uniref:Uncharacterized protein n=1 Tax=Dorcoceras hygrometricum TaxID=472368 RepID=A0A2Z7ADZ7_9LAMI|nr:hypothetical protein F511_36429 [Dorcoceras hygrometricum]
MDFMMPVGGRAGNSNMPHLSAGICARTQPTITRQCGIQARRLSRPPHQNNIGPFRRDDSAVRSQRAKESSSQRKQAQYAPGSDQFHKETGTSKGRRR